jgi:hypothetical protein
MGIARLAHKPSAIAASRSFVVMSVMAFHPFLRQFARLDRDTRSADSSAVRSAAGSRSRGRFECWIFLDLARDLQKRFRTSEDASAIAHGENRILRRIGSLGLRLAVIWQE